MSYVTKMQCPQCNEEGRDTAEDNMYIYPSGYRICHAGHGIISRGNVNSRSYFEPTDYITIRDETGEVIDGCSGVSDVKDPEILKYLWKYELKYWEAFSLRQVVDGTHMKTTIHNGIADYVNNIIEKGLLIPCSGAGLDNFIIRRIGELGPRTPKVCNSSHVSHFEAIASSLQAVVLVEDVFSAMKVQQNGFTAIALLGTSLREQVRTFICNALYSCGSTRIILWLDADTAGIQGAAKIKKQLLWITNKVTITNSEKDPKEMSDMYIRQHIENIIYRGNML